MRYEAVQVHPSNQLNTAALSLDLRVSSPTSGLQNQEGLQLWGDISWRDRYSEESCL